MGFGIKTKAMQARDWLFKERIPPLRRLFGDTTEHGELRSLMRLSQGAPNRFLVDVGANDGIRASNSYGLILRGWEAILIEPYPPCFEKLRRLYDGNSRIRLVN